MTDLKNERTHAEGNELSPVIAVRSERILWSCSGRVFAPGVRWDIHRPVTAGPCPTACRARGEYGGRGGA
jgi:hypothetical protein